MRIFKPLLAAAAVLSAAAPAASALADPIWGGQAGYERPHMMQAHFWREREMAREHMAWRRDLFWHEHRFHDRGYGYDRGSDQHYGWRY